MSKSRRFNGFDKAEKLRKLQVDCIVLGGVAHGALIQDIAPGAQAFEMARPTHLKPLTHSAQTQPEAAVETDLYFIHWVELQNMAVEGRLPQASLFGIAVVKGKNLTWAFSELVKGFIQNDARQRVDEASKPIVERLN